MSQVNLSLQTANQNFPAGTVAGKWRFTMTGLPNQENAGPSAAYLNVQAGIYTATAQRIDAYGNGLGPVASTVVEVQGAPVTIQVAAGVDALTASIIG